jgi:hypothetical protein
MNNINQQIGEPREPRVRRERKYTGTRRPRRQRDGDENDTTSITTTAATTPTSSISSSSSFVSVSSSGSLATGTVNRSVSGASDNSSSNGGGGDGVECNLCGAILSDGAALAEHTAAHQSVLAASTRKRDLHRALLDIAVRILASRQASGAPLPVQGLEFDELIELVLGKF